MMCNKLIRIARNLLKPVLIIKIESHAYHVTYHPIIGIRYHLSLIFIGIKKIKYF